MSKIEVPVFDPGCEGCEFKGDISPNRPFTVAQGLASEMTSSEVGSLVLFSIDFDQSNAIVDSKDLDKTPDPNKVLGCIAKCSGVGDCALDTAGFVPLEFEPGLKNQIRRYALGRATGLEIDLD